MSEMNEAKGNNRILNISLWVVQILLALIFGAAGAAKLFMPLGELALQMSFVADSSPVLVRFIGIVEIASALAMILPALTRILPILTPLAALGFAIIQVLAIPVHASYGELAQMLPINLALLALSAFVIWGRWKKLPIEVRS